MEADFGHFVSAVRKAVPGAIFQVAPNLETNVRFWGNAAIAVNQRYVCF
jgi:hypothetical protein